MGARHLIIGRDAAMRRSVKATTRLIELIASITVIFAWTQDAHAMINNAPTIPPTAIYSEKPVVAVLLSNKMTEATDFLAPYHILSRSGAFNVFAVAPSHELAPLLWGVSTWPHMDFETLDKRIGGADIVIVPALQDYRNPVILEWLRGQAAQGAMIVSICEGARVVAAAGLMEGKKATSHFFALKSLIKKHPNTNWRRGQRYIEDGNIISTAGVTAAIDASLRLVEKAAGSEAARAIAKAIRYSRDYRVTDYHAPRFRMEDIRPAIGGLLKLVRRSRIAIELQDDVDEISLAAFADALPRTLSLKAVFITKDNKPVKSRYGLEFSGVTPLDADFSDRINLNAWTRSGSTFSYSRVLRLIAEKRGQGVARFVAKQLEYPGWYE